MNSDNCRYNRQLILPEIGEAGQQKLSAARVLIVGVGGLGAPISTYLTGAGVGTIGIIDSDVVSITNLQRQVLYTEEQVGQSKVVCAKERLSAMNSEVTILDYNMRLTEENAEELISQYDIVVDGCDNFATRYVISDVCLKLGKPYVYGAITGLEGQVSVLCHQPCPKSYRDLADFLGISPQDTNAVTGMNKASGQVTESPVIGVTPGLVGTVEALQVLQLICQFGEPLINRLWTIDLRTLQTFCLEF